MNDQGDTLVGKTTSFFRPQFGISTVLLLISATAIWISYWNAKTENSRIESALPRLFELLGSEELQVEDPNQYAAIKLPQKFYHDNFWEVYLPPRTAGGTQCTYELLLATELISLRPSKTNAQAVPDFAVEIDAGRHHIQLLRQKQPSKEMKIEILLDGLAAISVLKPNGWWKPNSSSQEFKARKEQPIDQPLELTKTKFMDRTPAAPNIWTSSKEPSDGIFVWGRRKDSTGEIE